LDRIYNWALLEPELESVSNDKIFGLFNQSINQNIFIQRRVSQANQRREMAGTRWSKCQTVPSLTYGQNYREQFIQDLHVVKWERVPCRQRGGGANFNGFGWSYCVLWSVIGIIMLSACPSVCLSVTLCIVL